MRGIKEGDKVTAYWNGGTEGVDGTVEHMPSDTGDMIYLRDKAGNLHAINPNASSFEGLFKQEVPQK